MDEHFSIRMILTVSDLKELFFKQIIGLFKWCLCLKVSSLNEEVKGIQLII